MPLENLRLNQALARTGICSRRQADAFILAGRVQVNGKVITDFHQLIDSQKDILCVDGKKLGFHPHIYLALNKPPGYVTTKSDEHKRPTVMELLPGKFSHLKPVGRLDMYSQGLLLLTNDGALAQKLTHPRHHVNKTYLVKIRGEVSNLDLKKLADGIPLAEGPTLPAKVKLYKRNSQASEFEIILQEGRNKQIRRMCAYLDYSVICLARLAIGGLQLGNMPLGSWRYLSNVEIKLLFSKRP